MGNDKLKNVDINTLMRIAKSANKSSNKKPVNIENKDYIFKWVKAISLKEGPVKVLSSNLHKAFQAWVYDEGYDIEISDKKFGRVISELLHKTRSSWGTQYFCNHNPLESVTNVEEEKE